MFAKQNIFNIIQAFSEQLSKDLDLKNIYLAYNMALKQAVSLGYNSTIICPIMAGSPQEWAHFQAIIINEIVHFTNISPLPVCLISGGILNNTAQCNQLFLFYLLQSLRGEGNISSACAEFQDNSYKFNFVHNSSKDSIQKAENIKTAQHTINYKLNKKLNLRIFLLET